MTNHADIIPFPSTPTTAEGWIAKIKSCPHEVDTQQLLFELRRLLRIVRKPDHEEAFTTGLRQVWEHLNEPKAEPKPMPVLDDDTLPVETISLNVCDQTLEIKFYLDHVSFVFGAGYCGNPDGEINLTPEQVVQMMGYAQERVTWRSSPSRTEPVLCVYREGRTFTMDKVQWQGKHGIEVYNRIQLAGAQRTKLFSKIVSIQKKIAKLNATTRRDAIAA